MSGGHTFGTIYAALRSIVLSTGDSLLECMITDLELRMPYYSFDLVIGEEFRNQGSIILENLELASDKAEHLANELSLLRPELKKKGCAVRVTDGNDRELYRAPLDPIPSWKRSRAS